MKKIKSIGIGKDCPKCRKPMEKRKHTVRPKTSYFFTEWDYCSQCKHVQHYEEFKSTEWQESGQQESFFKSLR